MRKRLAWFGGLALCVSLASLCSTAAGETPAQQQEEAAVQAWGATHADCAEWGDTCVICKRDGDAAACSTTGIACTPQPTACGTPASGTKL